MERWMKRWLTAALVVTLFGGVIGIRAFSEGENDFHFSIIGDRTGGVTPQIYGRVWREVDLLHPDFVINVGDTINGRKDEIAQGQWDEIRPLFDRYKHYPLYFTAGNHDVWSDFSERLYQKETGRGVSYSFNYQSAHFTVLDNSRVSELSDEQLAFLEKDLSEHSEQNPKLVFFHRPFWIKAFQERGSDFELHRIVKKHGVDVVISGHGHVFVRTVRDGVEYMEVGSSGGTMAKGLIRGDGFGQGRFYHHIWARVQGSKVRFTVKELGGMMGSGRIFPAEDWNENGPQFNQADPALTYKPET